VRITPQTLEGAKSVATIVSFAEIEDEFIRRAHAAVLCNVATTDRRGRPRSRVLHTLWEGRTGWIASGRTSFKAKHIAREPRVSLTYMADPFKPVYLDCVAAWNDDPAEKRRLWALFGATPPLLGYDLAQFFGSVDNPDFGLLRLTPERIELADLYGQSIIWRV
jgi:general stress protein 26